MYDGVKFVGVGRWCMKDGYGKLEWICVLKSYCFFGVGGIIMKVFEKVVVDGGVFGFILNV